MPVKVFPFSSGSVTSSFAISSSFAEQAGRVDYVSSSISASLVLTPISGSPAAVDICIITFEQYQQIISGSHVEVC